MAIRYLLNQLDSAFVQEEDKLPRIVDRALGNIQSWLTAETEEAEAFDEKASANESLILLRKSSLFLASLAKCTSYCALIRVSREAKPYVLKAYSGSHIAEEGQSIAKMPPLRLGSWYCLKAEQAEKMIPQSQEQVRAPLHLQYINADYALVLVSSLPESKKSDLLAKVSDKIKRLGL